MSMRTLVHSVVTATAVLIAVRTASATSTPGDITSTAISAAATTASKDLVTRADEALNSITSTYYSTLDVWEPLKGVYKVVCAVYLDDLLNDALPTQYDAIKNYYGVGGNVPVWDYYGYFGNIAFGATKGGWMRMKRLQDLHPGDVIVWKAVSGSTNWGHVMIVAALPVKDSRYTNVYRVRVTDSAASPHSNDNRGSSGSGVGVGDMLFKVDAYGNVTARAWTTAGYFKTDTGYRLARPV